MHKHALLRKPNTRKTRDIESHAMTVKDRKAFTHNVVGQQYMYTLTLTTLVLHMRLIRAKQ